MEYSAYETDDTRQSHAPVTRAHHTLFCLLEHVEIRKLALAKRWNLQSGVRLQVSTFLKFVTAQGSLQEQGPMEDSEVVITFDESGCRIEHQRANTVRRSPQWCILLSGVQLQQVALLFWLVWVCEEKGQKENSVLE